MASLDESEIACIREGMRPFSDIEWFACDSSGCLAAFVTAGFAAVPLCVFDRKLTFSELYDRVDALPASSKIEPVDIDQGMNPFFVELAAKGLFVYDWNHTRGQYYPDLPYRLMTRPMQPLNITEVSLEGQIPTLPFAYSETPSIVIEAYFADLNLDLKKQNKSSLLTGHQPINLTPSSTQSRP